MSISDSDRRSCEGVQTGLDDQASPFRHAPCEKDVGGRKRTFGAYLLSLPIWLYRWLISPWIGPRCRYLPTCSEYALDALMQHGAIKGGWLAICRIGRCHPLGGQGFDPVPGKKMSRRHPKTVEDGRCGNETHTETGLDRRLSF